MAFRSGIAIGATAATALARPAHAGPPEPPSAIPPDTVQTIEPRPAPEPRVVSEPPSARPRESAPADAGTRIEAGGWAKQRVDVFPLELGRPQPGRSDVVSRTDLFVRARYSRAHHLEVNASGGFTHTIFHAGQDDKFRGAFDPELHEAYVGVFTSDLDFRFGQQRLAWGVTDFMSPNDVLNARDLRDPFLGEEELRFIPTPMLRADWYIGIVTLEAVVSPWFVPDRFDVYGTNWSGVQPSAPPLFQSRAAETFGMYDPSLLDQAQRLYQQTRLPMADYTEPSAGGQLAINGEGFDLHFMYHYGFDGPFVTLNSMSNPVAAYIRRHHVGTAATVALGPMVFRFEAAYQSQRVFFRTNLLSHKSPAGEVAAALEWQTGDPAKVALLEFRYQHIVEAPPDPLLAWDQESVGVGFSFRWPLLGPLRTDSRILVGTQPVTVVAKPELELNFDDWIVGAGWLGVAGNQPSFGSYYRRNNEAFAFVKWLF